MHARNRLPPIDEAARMHASRLRIERERSVLLIVDIQTQLAPHVADSAALVARAGSLIAAARMFAIPIVATEHCGDRIGPLVPPIRNALADDEVFAKTRFSAGDHPEFMAKLARTTRTRVVVAGMEAHVCVMQTVLAVAAAAYDVCVVADATGSRSARQGDRAHAFERLRAAGCMLAGTETVLFEWTRAGDDASFRDVLSLVKNLP
jgi:nicotinamidase-related amidase